MNLPPVARIVAPVGGTYTSPVAVEYDLEDQDSDITSVRVRYSRDGGVTFLPATEGTAAGLVSEGVTALTTTPAGTRHLFLWDAEADLGTAGATGILLELEPSDTLPGAIATSAPFGVAAALPTIPPPAPGIRLFEPIDNIGHLVPVVFVVNHPNDQPLTIAPEYSFAGSAFRPASPSPSSDALAALPASRHTLDYRFVWDAAADLGSSVRGTVTLRMTATDPAGTSTTTTSRPFGVNTAPPPALPATVSQPIMPIALTIESGDGQIGAAGYWFREPLKVRVRDQAQQPLSGVRISFAIEPDVATSTAIDPVVATSTAIDAVLATPTGDVEEEFGVGGVTGADGIASVRVRPYSAAVGAMRVVATVVGVPGRTAAFALQVRAPQIVASAANPAVPLVYGQLYEFAFLVDADGDLNTRDYWADRPPVLSIDCTGGDVSDVLCSANDTVWTGSASAIGVRVKCVPTVVTGALQLRVSVDGVPAIAPLVVVLPVATPAQARRLAQYQPLPRFDDVTARLEPVSGLDPVTGQAQTAYPGLTLATPFQVRLVDTAGVVYPNQVTSSPFGCVVPGLAPLDIVWSAGNGVLATTPTRGTAVMLTVPVSTPVYFTPTAAGDWLVEARVVVSPADPMARTFTWTDSSGTLRCHRENFLNGSVQRRLFLLRAPEHVGLEKTSLPGQLLGAATPGDLVRVVARGLSPFAFHAAQPPDPVRLVTKHRDGSAPTAIPGQAAPFSQDVTMQPDATTTALVSEPLLVLAGDPQITTASTHRHLVLFDAALEGRAPRLLFRLPTPRKARGRRLLGTDASLQESVVGSSPADGYRGSVRLPSGEMALSSVDWSFATRPHQVLFDRTWRGHLDGDGVFGPGWVFGFERRLDAAGRLDRVRLTDTTGLLHEFVNLAAPRGLFSELVRHPTVTPDQGRFVMTGAHLDLTHFNVDGSLRALEDRMGNWTRFAYNERAQLIEIRDAMGRICRLAYYTDADPVPDIVKGRLKSVTDFDQQTIEYAYYTDPDDPHGRPGFLKQCTWPAAPTRVGGQNQPAYRRSETYRYVKSNDRRDGQLLQVLDSESNVVLTCHYFADGRIERQEWNGGVATFAYPAARVREVVDGDGNKRTWTLAESPFQDGATPTTLVQHANRNVRPGQGDVTSTMTHNRHGSPLTIALADGTSHEWVYDDGATSPRAQGNLLMHREQGTGGGQRVWTWAYSQRFNFPIESVPPDGHAAGAVPRMFSSSYAYDANSGNLLRTAGPRVLNAVMVRNAADADELRWIHENPTVRFLYNGFGLATRREDERGVVTTFAYHDESTPTAGTFASDGGGFLAQRVDDADATSAREARFPGVPLQSATTRLLQDPRGDLRQVVDARGVTETVEHSVMRELVAVTRNAAVPAAATPADPIQVTLAYNARGHVERLQREQAGAPPLAGGAQPGLTFARDAEGRPTVVSVDLEQGRTAAAGLEYNKFGLVTRVTSPEARAGRRPLVVTEVVHDERHTPVTVTDAATDDQPGWIALSVTPVGGPLESSDAAVGTVTGTPDQFGAITAHRGPGRFDHLVLTSPSGVPNRAVLRPSGTTIGSPACDFEEVVRDEHGRTRRAFTGLLVEDDAGTRPVPPSKQYLPGATGATWPPVTTTALEDRGAWGPNDGRAGRDVLLDARGLMTRALADDNYRLWVRRAPHGGVLAAGDNAGLSLTADYTPAGDVERVRARLTSTDPLAPLTLTPSVKVDRDGAGRITRVVSPFGGAMRATYNARDRIVEVSDVFGADSSELHDTFPINLAGNLSRAKFDAGGLPRRIEIDLTTGGVGGAPPEDNPDNSNAKVTLDVEYDDDGRITMLRDSHDRVYELKYDRRGRFIGLAFPASVAVPSGANPSIVYDAADRIETSTDANGSQVQITYYQDRPHLIEEIKVMQRGAGVLGTDGYRFEYNGQDRVKKASELGSTRRVELDYDSAGRTLRERQNPEVVYVHDGAGKLLRVEYPQPGGPALVYHYDADDPRRPRRIEIDGAGDLAAYEYVGSYALRSRQAGPLHIAFGYRADQALKQMVVTGLFAGTVQFDVELDKDGRPTKLTRTFATLVESWQWERDSAGRIVKETAVRRRAPAQIETTRRFDGDSVCTRRGVMASVSGTAGVEEVTTHQGEERGRVVSRTVTRGTIAETTTLVYDAAGNLKQDDRNRYAYDAFQRLIRVEEIATGSTADYTYDAFGRRTRAVYSVVAPGAPAIALDDMFVYDGTRLIQVMRGGIVVEQYLWGRAHEELVRVDIADGTSVRRFHIIQRPDGWIDTLVDDNALMVEGYDYDLYGQLTVLDAARERKAGNWTGFADAWANRPLQRIGFMARPRDPVTGLIDVGGRVFNPRLGVFLQPDPAGVGLCGNGYIVALHDPVGPLSLWEFPRAQELASVLTEGHALSEGVWGFVGAAATSFLVGVLIIGAAAVCVAAGIVSVPVLLAVGVVALVGTAAVATTLRMTRSDQSFPTALAGGTMDALMITDVGEGLFERDLASWTPLSLPAEERGAKIGGVVGTLASGGPAKRFMGWGTRYRFLKKRAQMRADREVQRQRLRSWVHDSLEGDQVPTASAAQANWLVRYVASLGGEVEFAAWRRPGQRRGAFVLRGRKNAVGNLPDNAEFLSHNHGYNPDPYFRFLLPAPADFAVLARSAGRLGHKASRIVTRVPRFGVLTTEYGTLADFSYCVTLERPELILHLAELARATGWGEMRGRSLVSKQSRLASDEGGLITLDEYHALFYWNRWDVLRETAPPHLPIDLPPYR